MKKRKKLLLISIAIFILIGVCCCMSTETKLIEPERMKNLALEYLNEKYDDTFTAKSYTGPSWAYNYSKVVFTSEKYSEKVNVIIYEDDRTYSFQDDYYQLTMKEDAKKYFEAYTSKYGYIAEAKVTILSLGVSGVDANARFTDYISNGKCSIEVYFISNTAFEQSDIEAIMSDLSEAKIFGFYRFVVTDDSDLLSQYSIKEILNEKTDSILEIRRYSIDEQFEIVDGNN